MQQPPPPALENSLLNAQQVEQLRAGDERAWFELILAYERRVYAFLYRLEGEQHAALDLTQETFFRAWRSFSTFQPQQPLLPWLFTIARNTQIESHRRKQHARFSLDRAHEELGYEVPSEAHSPARTAERADAQDRVQQALMQLGEEYREAVVLRFIEDLPYEDIAQIQGVALGTAKSRVYRAKEQLADLLSADLH